MLPTRELTMKQMCSPCADQHGGYRAPAMWLMWLRTEPLILINLHLNSQCTTLKAFQYFHCIDMPVFRWAKSTSYMCFRQNMVKSCLCLDGNSIWNWMLYIHLKYIFLAFSLFTSQAFFLFCSTPFPPPLILTPHPTHNPTVRNFISIWEQYSIAVHYKASSSKERLGWAVRRIAGRLSMSQSDSRVFVVSLRAVSQFPYIDLQWFSGPIASFTIEKMFLSI